MPEYQATVIEAQTCHVDLHNSNSYIIFIPHCRDEGIEPPFQVQELEEIHLILMLYVLIVFDDVCEHVMHVVFGAPPFRGKTTE